MESVNATDTNKEINTLLRRGTAAAAAAVVVGDDIKDFAETTMNELLGWYGYATKVESKSSGKSTNSGKDSSEPEDSPKALEGCGWCGKPIGDVQPLSSGVASFCSELCFSQSRRATFKRSKTCDWCRHVRHTVSYVDFQDGISQLQFCSDKCLNQYKMHIFCRETRAHLELHPHVPPENECENGLITPDMWLKNCKSPEPFDSRDETSRSPLAYDCTSKNVGRDSVQTSPLPLITVTHSSKLMATQSANETTSLRLQNVRTKLVTKPKKHRICVTSSVGSNSTAAAETNDLPQDLRIRHGTPQTDDAVREEARVENKSQYSHVFPEPNVPQFRQSGPNIFSPFSTSLPPVTIMVPYPILVPIPLPIPIPMPSAKLCGEDQESLIKLNDLFKSSLAKQREQESSQSGCMENKETNDSSQDTTLPLRDDDEEKTTANKLSSITKSDGRPLRKRKKIVETTKQQSKSAIKSKKYLSVL